MGLMMNESAKIGSQLYLKQGKNVGLALDYRG